MEEAVEWRLLIARFRRRCRGCVKRSDAEVMTAANAPHGVGSFAQPYLVELPEHERDRQGHG